MNVIAHKKLQTLLKNRIYAGYALRIKTSANATRNCPGKWAKFRVIVFAVPKLTVTPLYHVCIGKFKIETVQVAEIAPRFNDAIAF